MLWSTAPGIREVDTVVRTRTLRANGIAFYEYNRECRAKMHVRKDLWENRNWLDACFQIMEFATFIEFGRACSPLLSDFVFRDSRNDDHVACIPLPCAW